MELSNSLKHYNNQQTIPTGDKIGCNKRVNNSVSFHKQEYTAYLWTNSQ